MIVKILHFAKTNVNGTPLIKSHMRRLVIQHNHLDLVHIRSCNNVNLYLLLRKILIRYILTIFKKKLVTKTITY